MTTPGPHILYRLYNADKELLYIGVTNGLDLRFYEHARSKPWWGEVTAYATRRPAHRNHQCQYPEIDPGTYIPRKSQP